MSRLRRILPPLVLAVGLATACGGGGAYQTIDTNVDGWDVDTGGEVAPDGEDVPTDVPADVETDDGPARTYRQFATETSGGGRISSANYQIELFVAPVRPVSSAGSESFTVKLGPGAVRSE